MADYPLGCALSGGDGQDSKPLANDGGSASDYVAIIGGDVIHARDCDAGIARQFASRHGNTELDWLSWDGFNGWIAAIWSIIKPAGTATIHTSINIWSKCGICSGNGVGLFWATGLSGRLFGDIAGTGAIRFSGCH